MSPDSAASAVILDSVPTCPKCGQARQEAMPVDSCLFYCEWAQCKTLLPHKAEDCCVFCSYGSLKCPPMQAHQAAARGNRSAHAAKRCCGSMLLDWLGYHVMPLNPQIRACRFASRGPNVEQGLRRLLERWGRLVATTLIFVGIYALSRCTSWRLTSKR